MQAPEVVAKHPPWTVCRVAQGLYYCNEVTGETTWQQPPELAAVLGGGGGGGGGGGAAPVAEGDQAAVQQMQLLQQQQQQQQAQAQQAAYMQQMQQQAAAVAYFQQMQQMQQQQMGGMPQHMQPGGGGGGQQAFGGAPAPALDLPVGRQTGSLKKFFEDKGFGFIQCDNSTSGDIFVHHRQVKNGDKDDLAIGVRLSFDVEPDDRSGKAKATNVMIEGR